MPAQSESQHTYASIDQRLAAVLRMLSDHYLQREIAGQLKVAESTVNRLVADLKQLTGCGNTGELARWWRDNQVGWIRHQAEVAGVDLTALATG